MSKDSEESASGSDRRSHKFVASKREVSAKARKAQSKKNKFVEKMETLTETVRNNSTISKFRAAARKEHKRWRILIFFYRTKHQS